MIIFGLCGLGLLEGEGQEWSQPPSGSDWLFRPVLPIIMPEEFLTVEFQGQLTWPLHCLTDISDKRKRCPPSRRKDKREMQDDSC